MIDQALFGPAQVLVRLSEECDPSSQARFVLAGAAVALDGYSATTGVKWIAVKTDEYPNWLAEMARHEEMQER